MFFDANPTQAMDAGDLPPVGGSQPHRNMMPYLGINFIISLSAISNPIINYLMADPFVAEIRIVPINFPPKGWAFFNGQLLPFSQNTALFSLLGTYYGGNGKSTFALPDLQGRAPLHPGQGSGLSNRFLGEEGRYRVRHAPRSEIPAHNHLIQTANAAGDSNIPTANAIARSANGSVYGTIGGTVQLAPQALTPAGGSLPHNNMMRYLTLNLVIALQGVYPAHP